MPMVLPILSPKERLMMKYSPPPSTRVSVASSPMARAVGRVMRWPMSTINMAPQKPRVPTAKPKRRKRMAPRMVEMAVKNTGAVPKPRALEAEMALFFIYQPDSLCQNKQTPFNPQTMDLPPQGFFCLLPNLGPPGQAHGPKGAAFLYGLGFKVVETAGEFLIGA